MTGAVNRDFWTRGSFADFVACTVLGEPRRADFDFVNLHVQNSWQAQHFVNLEVQISWQAQHFVNLEVQISWQVQQFVKVQISWQVQ